MGRFSRSRMKSMSRWMVFVETSSSSASFRQFGNFPALSFSWSRIIRSSGGRDNGAPLSFTRAGAVDLGRTMSSGLPQGAGKDNKKFCGWDRIYSLFPPNRLHERFCNPSSTVAFWVKEVINIITLDSLPLAGGAAANHDMPPAQRQETARAGRACGHLDSLLDGAARTGGCREHDDARVGRFVWRLRVPGRSRRFDAGANRVITWDGENGIVVNSLVGADTFYNEGVWGQGTVTANVEAGLVWNGHETTSTVQDFYVSPGASGEFGNHATGVGSVIAGYDPTADPNNYPYYKLGMAPLTTLSSGAIATNWYNAVDPVTGGTNTYFNVTAGTFYSAYNHYFTQSATHTLNYGGFSFQFYGANGCHQQQLGMRWIPLGTRSPHNGGRRIGPRQPSARPCLS